MLLKFPRQGLTHVEGRNEMNQNEENLTQEISLPILEVVCDRCRGEGGYQEYSGWVDCCYCGGAGYIPTDAGEKILALIRHNIKLNSGGISWR